MADIFDEIQEDIQQEKWTLLWQKYQNYIYGIVIAVILITTSIVWWQNYQRGKIAQQSETYVNAVTHLENNPQAFLEVFERLPAEGENAYADLARFWAAALLLDKGDEAGAKTIYASIIKNSGGVLNTIGGNKVFHDLALIRNAYIQADTEDPAILLKKLDPLATPENPWRFSAYELSGMLKMKLKDIQGAIDCYQKIVDDPTVTPSFKMRAQAMINILKNEK